MSHRPRLDFSHDLIETSPMIRALAMETSGKTGSIALVEDDQIVANDAFSHGLQHAATILPMIDQLTRQRGWSPQQIDHIYVSAGPGSFTGLRIGITLAKTLAFATGSRIVAVPSLRVLLCNAPDDADEVILVLDAKRGQIFTAKYQRSSDHLVASEEWREMESPHLDTLDAMLARASRPVHLIGEGIPWHMKNAPDGVILTDESRWRGRAESVAKIGAEMARLNLFADSASLTPLYIRLPEAEEKRLIAEGRIPDPTKNR